ncbi:MFS transporter [Gleimia hominis]|uniref:MFS transporter n=1 Tax=Gleimia hominis TaxID=595468 RepID=UPI001E4B427B|nr:MFS transporter [Gleimia hominis]WIK64409.1 MFS transporter [Gleimia hominis]
MSKNINPIQDTAAINQAAQQAQQKKSRLPIFLRRGRVGGFLTVVMAGQLTYSAFEAFKGSLMLPLCNALGITVGQFGTLMSFIGIAMFLYPIGGWVNNRFTIRSLLITWSAWRLVTFLALYICALPFMPDMPFKVMIAIAISWGVWDALGWPAVVNGVTLLSKDANTRGRGLAMSLLETIRRGAEFLMNAVILLLLWIYPGSAKTIMLAFGFGYTLLLVPLIILILRTVPKNAIAEHENMSKNTAALYGLWQVLTRPRVWLAGVAGMCLYWTYVNLIYSSAPYVKLVFNASDSVSGVFGIITTGAVGMLVALVAGGLADYVFKSSTLMLGVALAICAVAAGVVYLLPADQSMLWFAMSLLVLMSVGIFMGKAVILAPIAELNLPDQINGSAMAIGSLAVYAPVFWGNFMTAGIIDRHADNPYEGYQVIFLITLAVAVIGAVCAFVLAMINRRIDHRNAQAGHLSAQESAVK